MPNVGPADFESLRTVMYFGSPISPELARRAIATFGCEFHQFYGATEAWFLTILHHREHIGDHPARLASCGVPLPMVSIRVADAAGAEVGPGVIGEVLVRTPMMFAGYWNKPNATAEALRDGWYHTGDLARRDEDGFLYIVDRAKDMIISGGENIYSTEIEMALQKLPGVRMCAVIGMPDEKWGERVVAVIIRDPAVELTGETVIAHCRRSDRPLQSAQAGRIPRRVSGDADGQSEEGDASRATEEGYFGQLKKVAGTRAKPA